MLKTDSTIVTLVLQQGLVLCRQEYLCDNELCVGQASDFTRKLLEGASDDRGSVRRRQDASNEIRGGCPCLQVRNLPAPLRSISHDNSFQARYIPRHQYVQHACSGRFLVMVSDSAFAQGAALTGLGSPQPTIPHQMSAVCSRCKLGMDYAAESIVRRDYEAPVPLGPGN